MILWIDVETRSPVPINAGTARYATQVEVIICTWAVDDGPAQCWDITAGRTMPDSLRYAAEECDEIWAHKEYFDRTMLERTDWWPKEHAPNSKWRCTMTMALMHGLPGALEKLCEIFKVDAQNTKLDGKEYIQIFCKPKKDGTYNDRNSHPEQWKAFLKYATRDIPAMREIYRKCPKWNMNPTEMRLWHLDQQINDRGFAVDVEMAAAAVRATTAEKKRLSERTMELTGDVVERTTQRNLLLGYLLLEYGVSLPDLKADTIERRLDDPELPEFVKELLRIRLKASKASTAKYKRILQAEVGGRIYGGLQFCGALRTGRWAGRLVQPQNFPRPEYKFADILIGIDAIKADCEDIVVDDIMRMTSSALRSVIIAAKGKKLVCSDLANIEGRAATWLAGEKWKLEAFSAYDRKEGPDLYKVAYARSFGVQPEDVEDESDERQIGKVQELSLGYEGGVGAFVTMAVTYGVDLELMAEKAMPAIDRAVLRDAQSVYAWASRNKRAFGLSEKVYVVCEAIKRLWRDAHPEISGLWPAYEHAAKNAAQNPGIAFPVGPVVFDRVKNWLRIRLPSGRYLCYAVPRVEGNKLSYMGVNPYTKQWNRVSTYGGKLFENVVQASSRDIIADAMPRAEAEGYKIVLTVHDEIMAEVPDEDAYNDGELSRILSTNPAWSAGLPLAAKGFTTYRYKKS